jgi:hypothetical protein
LHTVDHHERQHQAIWDELLGKVRASQILAPHPESPDDDTAERVLMSMRKADDARPRSSAFNSAGRSGRGRSHARRGMAIGPRV